MIKDWIVSNQQVKLSEYISGKIINYKKQELFFESK